MKNNNLVITTSNWASFVASLRSNLKLGYGVCSRTSYRNNYFSAVIQQGTDRAYIARLNSVTGEEKESTLDLCDFLGSCLVPFPQELMTEINELIGIGEANKQKDALELDKPLPKENVELKIQRKPRQRKVK